MAMEGKAMENYTFGKMHRRLIKSFLDVIILRALMSRPMGGSDVVTYIHKRFGILISSGTVYSTLYSMERQGMIEGGWQKGKKKKVYTLTPNGKEAINAVSKTKEKILNALVNVLPGK